MKNKKTFIMGIIIGVLLVVICILSFVIIKDKDKKDAGTTESILETENTASDDTETTTTEQASEADTSKENTEASDEENEKNVASYMVDINQSGTWEEDGKKCATENITICNNTSDNVKDWKMDIIFASDISIADIWNGDEKVEGNTLSITPLDYNSEIPSKGNVSFGYNISSEDLTISDYILYIGDKTYNKAELLEQKKAADEARKAAQKEKAKNAEPVVPEEGTPVDNHGKLSVKGTDIVDEEGNAYQLKGCSTHGITWFPDYVDIDTFKTFRDDWGANLIRLAMYTDTGDSYGYCSGGDKDTILDLLDKGVSAATELGMYVIVDWHILNDNNPNNHIDDAKDFFEIVTTKYKDYDNVIYEICNEPNGGTKWEDIKEYAETIIPIIREQDEDAIIIVGTPTWSQDVDIAAGDPLAGYDNIMYAVHFYAATHKQDLRDKVTNAIDKGLPIFVSEFSICDASGNGAVDYDEAEEWFSLIEDKNLSYAAWNISNKDETSALIDSSCSKISDWTDDELSETGDFIKGKISGQY
ncbi:MAG: cellulase family glycosylhydrolase [Coprococcus sp.]